MGSKQEPDFSISLTPDCDIKWLAWGFTDDLGVCCGFMILDSYEETIAYEIWAPEDIYDDEIVWQYTELSKGEKLVGFYGNLYKQRDCSEIYGVGFITSKIITKHGK